MSVQLMSTELDQAREIAERIARKLSQGERRVVSPSPSIEPLPERTQQPYYSQPTPPGLSTHSPWLAGINAPYQHPSQEKFGVEEATISELVDYFEKEKLCSVEPGGKPCDHCAMCNTRGF